MNRSPPAGTRIPVESPDPCASLWGAIQETLQAEGVPLRGGATTAHRALYALFARPGHAPDPVRVLDGLRRDAAVWRARAADLRAAGEPDVWRYTLSLAKWISERRWEAGPDPEAPAPRATASAPRARADMDREERERTERAAATARGESRPRWMLDGIAKGVLDAQGRPVRRPGSASEPSPVAEAVREVTRRKGPPS